MNGNEQTVSGIDSIKMDVLLSSLSLLSMRAIIVNSFVLGVCSLSQFQCANEACIPLAWVCDGQAECTDGSDESIDVCKGESFK